MSGKAGSFKRANKTVVLGIGGALGHDANAALIVDGKLIASSQEERFTRVKHDGQFPAHAIHDCLQIAGLKTQDVTVCVFAEKPLQSSLFKATGRANSQISRWLGNLLPPAWCGFYNAPARRMLPNAEFCYAWHHFSHVAGAFYTSPFESSAFLCVDGKGEDLNASIGRVGHHYLEMTHEQKYENGLGLLYTLVTVYLGFPSFGSEYKVMGLAPYGEPTYAARLRKITQQDACGGFRLSDQVAFTDRSLLSAVKLVADATGLPPRTEEVPLNTDYINIRRIEHALIHARFPQFSRHDAVLRAAAAENQVLFSRLLARKISHLKYLFFEDVLQRGGVVNDSAFRNPFDKSREEKLEWRKQFASSA